MDNSRIISYLLQDGCSSAMYDPNHDFVGSQYKAPYRPHREPTDNDSLGS